MEKSNPSKVIAILADLPLWTFPGFDDFPVFAHYATWLEPLVSEFGCCNDLDIHWITFSKKVTSYRMHTLFGQTVHILPRRKKMISMLSGYLFEILAVRRVLGSINPALVHAWGSEDVYGLAGAFGPVRNRLFTLQGCLTNLLSLRGGWLFRLQTLYEKPSIRRYLYGTSESPSAMNSLLAIHPGMKVRLVDYGVNLAFFDAEWNPSHQPEVVFLGNVVQGKGIIDLIEAAQSPELKHLKFKIIGDGHLLPSLRAESPANVEWLGRCKRDAVIDHLARAWCLVMPTYADTGPTVVKEARVMGLPVVTTTSAGASCYIKQGQSGFVIRPGDIEGLRRSLLQVCASRETCLTMGRHGWEEIRKQLHPRMTANNFATIYREMTSDK